MKKINKHYDESTIVEAIIELRLDKPLELEENRQLENQFVSKYSIAKDELVVYTAILDPSGMTLKHDKPGQLRLKINISEHIFVQIFPDRFSFHWLGKYPGWAKFEEVFSGFLKELDVAIPDLKCQQLGIRFINKINEKTSRQRVGYWLKASTIIPKNIRSSKNDYFYRSRWPLKPNRWAQVCIAESVLDAKNRPLMFDIDVLHFDGEALIFNESLLELASEIHDEVYAIFKSSISINYEKLLNKKNV